MLKVTGLLEGRDGEVRVDPYVPLKFKAYDNALAKPTRWRVGDFRLSLFEILIDRSSSAVLGFTLTLPTKERVASLPDGYRTVHAQKGVPIIDMSGLGERDVVDEPQAFWVATEGSDAFVLFDALAQPDSVAESGRARFFLAGDKLIGVGAVHLSDEEQQQLRERLRRI